VLALVAALSMGLLWAGVVRYQAEQRALAVAKGESAEEPEQVPAAVPVPAVTTAELPAPKPLPQLVVHVAGAVAHPGVYKLDEGARVADALAAAGGPLPEAAPDALNLADKLADGQKVYVFTKQELASPTPPPAAAGAIQTASTAVPAKPAGKVNINTATAAQLDQVPGVSLTLANDIVAYRNQHGPFKRLEDLDNVKGIGPATIEKLRPHITL
jgi:competence protein ComEA